MHDRQRAQDDAASLWPPRRVAWWGLAMLVVCYAISIVDRIGMGLLIQPIEASLHITDTQIGLLQGLGFALFFAVLGLPIGLLADRANRRSLIVAGIAVWSLATIGCGLATSFLGLMLGRIGVGAGEATLTPAGMSMIGDYFPPEQRSRAFGVFGLGSSMGTGTAFLFTGSVLAFAAALTRHYPGLLGDVAPWKIVFALFGLPGLIMVPILLLTVREPTRREGWTPPNRVSLQPLFARLSAHRMTYIALIGGIAASFIATYALIGWFPSFLIRAYGWTPARTAGLLGVVGLPCGIASSLSAGWIVSMVERRRGGDATVLVAAVTLAGIAAGSLIIALSPNATVAIVGYACMGLAMNIPGVSLMTALNLATPNALRGQVLAVLTITTSLLSQTVGPFVVGYLNDHVYTSSRGIGGSLSTTVIGACATAIVLLLIGRRAIRADLTPLVP